MNPCSAATPAVVHGSVKGKPHRRATCAAKARSKHGKARKRALRRCRAAAHKQAKRRHT